ncbi:MAG: NAD(P)/FAD-dependent oxidoreductase [Bacillota bacterium]
MSTQYDVIIIGAGPAGIFAALELAEANSRLDVLILEKGKHILERKCPMQVGRPCLRCCPCAVLCGWGGAGAFSDGKLTLTSEFGGFLDDYLPRSEVDALIDHIDRIYVRFGAEGGMYGDDPAGIRDLVRQAAAAGLQLVPARVRHLGTERCPAILSRMFEYLSGRVDVLAGTEVKKVLVRDGRAYGVVTTGGKEYRGRYVLCAPGREGAEWFAQEGQRLGLELTTNPVDVGVRVEIPAVVFEHLTQRVYEPKILYYSRAFDDLVRTFCVCPNGEVVLENNRGLITVNGHSFRDQKTDNTNFALLVSKTFTEPFHEPIAYGKYVASLANMLGDGVLVQRLGDLLSGRRSTAKRLEKGMVRPTLEQATPGDLSLVLPYRHLRNILEMLEALDQVAPGVHSKHTLLYGVEVKFYSSRPRVSPELETEIQHLFAVGDGAGVTRSLAQASASGVLAARSILKREEANSGV